MDPYDYAMLFDVDTNVLGDLITVWSGGWALELADTYADISAEIMDAFEYVTPEGFDGSFASENMLRNGTVSHHMNTLVRDGFVSMSKSGTRINYTLQRKKVEEFLKLLKMSLLE